ncbi:MAG: pyrimidine-nucleoside phosphorylase [Oscillospiraceae bacterium]|nr:pyrimidine-nucleoside phosphorylase [Oscillospiraceae bacterium]
MKMYDVITNKKHGLELSEEEIRFFVEGFTNGEIPDYQASALLMAICLKGMNSKETAYLTDSMAKSGDMADLSDIPGIKVDKHSTGGVGDKTSLIVGPIVAACGVPVAKMSGRGLGHTGGTVDKLESIPGMQTALDKDRFISIVRDVGLSIIGQSGNIAPADKKLYALRDVTATVDNIPLIASSIMSKKLAAGSNAILLDVKTGSGAFMKTVEDSANLAREMVAIGEHMGRRMAALITNMDAPLGMAIGNSLEVIESVDTLNGRGPEDLSEVCVELAANMLWLADKGELETCRSMARKAVESGAAFERLLMMVSAQGGDTSPLKDASLFDKSKVMSEYKALKSGFITHMQTEMCGAASVALGAGRARKEDSIDYGAGIILERKTGDYVNENDVIARLYTSEPGRLNEAVSILNEAVVIAEKKPELTRSILARITSDGIEYYR